MYTLRPFMRMNTPRRQGIERFVQAVAGGTRYSGSRLSVRDIELLAQGYFRGPASLREAIEGDKLNWSLDQLKHVPEDREGCNGVERGFLRDLELLRKSVERVMARCHDPRLGSPAFLAQANLLSGGLLSTLAPFSERMKELHDRSGLASCPRASSPCRKRWSRGSTASSVSRLPRLAMTFCLTRPFSRTEVTTRTYS
jgi:hypothetical protein